MAGPGPVPQPPTLELTPAHLERLRALRSAGFELANFPLFAGHVGVKKYGCAALLQPLPDGQLKVAAQPGYLIEGNIAVRVERGGEQWFVWKSRQVRAAEALLTDLRRFEDELRRLLETEPAL